MNTLVVNRKWTDEKLEEFLGVVQRVTSTLGHRLPGGYCCLEDFVLREGRPMLRAAPGFPAGVLPGRRKQCFKNAASLVLEDGRLTYCEGYAAGVIPVLHAWAVDKNGLVVDPTWPDGEAYRGVAFKREYFMERLEAQGGYGLLDCYEDKWPVLRDSQARWRIEL